MSEVGIRRRLERLSRDGRYFLLAMDHGVTQGPLAGLVDPATTAAACVEAGADAVVTHRGLVDAVAPAVGSAGYVVHLSASTALGPDPDDKRLVCTVAEAVRLGADAVSVHVNLASDAEASQLEDLGAVVGRAHRRGVPVLAMVYPRGPGVEGAAPEAVAHAARVGGELGADLVKTALPDGDLEPAVAGAGAPLLVAGGVPDDPRATLERLAAAMDAGAAGASIGRTVFQAANPGAMARAVAAVVHEGVDPASAAEHLGA
ncbi:MAG: 2-amino-3,7-dideoxy-D-threo-hept-6-ulosonate synthase [Halobacteriales archaeon]